MADISDRIATIALPDGSQVRVSLQATKDGPGLDVRAYRAFTAAKALMPTQAAITVPLAAVPDLVIALERALSVAIELGVKP